MTSHVRLAVTHDGRLDGNARPGLRLFTDTGPAGRERGRHPHQLLTLTDLYTILQGMDSNGSGGVSVKVLVNPVIGMIWLAGRVFLLGALITIWPDPREVRMLARRYAGALAREA